MPTESILATFLTAAAYLKKPIQEVASQALQDAYDATRAHLRKKLGGNAEAGNALESAMEKPESTARKAVLCEETASSALETDAELGRLIERLSALLPQSLGTSFQDVQVIGQGNRVQVAGRDLVIKTEKHFQRNAITPDERHLTEEQRDKIRAVIGELAMRLAVGESGPNFAAVHRMIHRRYSIASYLLIPRDKFEDALAFLILQRAIHRSRLRRRNPVAYQNDFFRSIYAGAAELGWKQPQVYEFAFDKLGLRKPVTSLKQVRPVQLKALADFVRQQVRKSREANDVHASQTGRVGKGLDPFSNDVARGDYPAAGAESLDATSEA